MTNNTTSFSPRPTTASLTIAYLRGYAQYFECAMTRDWLSPEEYAAMTDAERCGYEAAARDEADTDTYVYLANVNSFGDRTDGAA
jgi:hypothetical protein